VRRPFRWSVLMQGPTASLRVVGGIGVLLLAGCAEPAGSGADPSPTAASSSAADVDDELMIVLDRGDGTEPEHYTLSCGGVPDGDHPDASAACAHLEGLEEPFVALPTDMVCTEQYGGPETAQITGRWHAADVDLDLSRTNGCRIAQWESLGPVLPPVDGAVPN
jgi:hypothetical protein